MTSSRGVHTTARLATVGLVCLAVLGLSAGCGGGEEGGGGTPTRTPVVSPTRTADGPTRTPTRTEEPSDQSSEEPSEEPSDEPSDEPSEQPTDQADETEAPAEEPPATDDAADPSDESVPAGVWVLLAVLAVAGVVVWLLVLRARRRRAWHDRLRAAEVDVAWTARELLPQLKSTTSLDRARGGWEVALPRISAAEDQLTVLESSAPDDAGRARARTLRDAVRGARARMERLTVARPDDLWMLDVDDAIAALEAALAKREV